MNEEVWTAVGLSMMVALWCTLIGFPIAVSIGYLLARRDFIGKSLLATLCAAPVVLPPVVIGFLLLRFLGEGSAFGRYLFSIGVRIPFTLAGAVIASLVVGLPFYILSARTAFELVDSRLIDLAKSLGRTRWQVFQQVSLPLALPGVGAGAVLSFARSLGEFGATAVLAGNTPGQTRTISLAVYSYLDSPTGEEKIWPLVTFSLVSAFMSLLAYEWLNRWQRRRMELQDGP